MDPALQTMIDNMPAKTGKSLDEWFEVLKLNPLIDERTVNPDVVMGKPYFEFKVDRDESARYGMTTEMVNEIVGAGLGGVNVTNTVEGRERYPVQVRFRRDIREQVDLLGKVPVVTPTGDMVGLTERGNTKRPFSEIRIAQ